MRALIVEDDAIWRRLLMHMLNPPNLFDDTVELSMAETKERALAILAGEVQPDVVILDLNLPDSSDLATLAAVARAATDIPIIIVTSLDNEEIAFESVAIGAQDYLLKGRFKQYDLIKAVYLALARKEARHLKGQINGLRGEADSTCGNLRSMQRHYNDFRKLIGGFTDAESLGTTKT